MKHILIPVALSLAALLSTPAARAAYQFTDVNVPLPTGDANGSLGTTVNGLSNNGTLVGFVQDSAGAFNNFTDSNGSISYLNAQLTMGTAANANGVNSAGTVVGSDVDAGGNTVGFMLPPGGTEIPISPPLGETSTALFGINDKNVGTGQVTYADGTAQGIIEGYPLALTPITIPSFYAGQGFTTLQVQGINNNGLAVGFFTDTATGVSHGFTYQYAPTGFGITAENPAAFTVLADPTDPYVGTNDFLFSQVLGINDAGIAAGYFGTTTDLQHGFLYDTHTGAYTYLDDPNVLPGGSAIMQITGINNAGEIAGFYSGQGGTLHGFTGAAVPEPSPLVLLGLPLGLLALRRRRQA